MTYLPCSDIPIKQLILHLNTKEHFVVKDIDDTHILVETDRVEDIKRMIAEILEKNIYDSSHF